MVDLVRLRVTWWEALYAQTVLVGVVDRISATINGKIGWRTTQGKLRSGSLASISLQPRREVSRCDHRTRPRLSRSG